MAKYTFSQGKVEVEEGIYLPILRKERRLMRTGVLIVIPPRPHVEGQTESTVNMDRENAHDQQ